MSQTTTFTALAENIANRLLTVGLTPAHWMFATENVTEQQRHRSYTLAPSLMNPRLQAGEFDTDIDFAITVQYSAGRSLQQEAMARDVMADTQAIMSELARIESYLGPMTASLQPSADDAFFNMAYVVRFNVCVKA